MAISEEQNAALRAIWKLSFDMEQYRSGYYQFGRPEGCGLKPIPDDVVAGWVKIICESAEKLAALQRKAT